MTPDIKSPYNLYRPQTKFAKVMFLQVSVCPHGGACLTCMHAPPLGMHPRECLYRPPTKFPKVMFSQVSVCPQGGACLTCMHAPPGHAPPRMHARWAHTPPGMHPSGHARLPRRILRDALYERAVRILLVCIHVLF